jgi:hypothetical protein
MNMNRWPFWLQVFNMVGLQPHFKCQGWRRDEPVLDQSFLHPWFSYIIFFYASVGVASNASSARCSSVSAETLSFVGWKVYISNASEQSRLFFCSLHGWNIKSQQNHGKRGRNVFECKHWELTTAHNKLHIMKLIFTWNSSEIHAFIQQTLLGR